MSEPAAESKPLSYSVGLQRRFGGWRDVPGWWRLYWVGLLGGGVMALMLSASIFWLPALAVVIVGLLQGVVIGECLRQRVQKDAVRVGWIILVVATSCGLLSVLAVHGLFYAYAAYEASELLGSHSALDRVVDLVTNRSGANGFKVLSLITADSVGREGFLGYVLHRAQFSNRRAGIVLLHLLITVIASWMVARSALRAPACPDCGEWLGEERNVAVVPGWLTAELRDAVATGSPEKAFEVGRQAAGQDLGSDCAIARTMACPACHRTFAYVARSSSVVGDRQLLTTTASLGGLVPASPEMVRALKSEHVLPVDASTEPLTVVDDQMPEVTRTDGTAAISPSATRAAERT